VKNRLGITLSFSQTATEAPAPEETTAPAAPPRQDAFVQAVRLAEQAVQDGQTADTAAAWLDLAARWQRAADLMDEVTPDDPRYPTAQDRVTVYRQNSEQALQRSQQFQAEPEDAEAP
jgi:hypothetical protein